jgi:UPF0716 protein FxsA
MNTLNVFRISGWKFFIILAGLMVLLPLTELMLILWTYQYVGFFMTILIVLGTGVVGAAVAKSQGLLLWQKIILDVRAGRSPTNQVIDGVLILIAGILLITPGILTDITGLLLLMPWTRFVIRESVKYQFFKSLKTQFTSATESFTGGTVPDPTAPQSSTGQPEIIDVEYTIKESKTRKSRKSPSKSETDDSHET